MLGTRDVEVSLIQMLEPSDWERERVQPEDKDNLDHGACYA